jgi:hypothetical protein
MRSILLAGAGMMAVCVYCTAVVLGGVLWPAYRHVAQPVSDLIATGSPVKPLLDPLFFLYNLLTAAFAWGLLGVARRTSRSSASWSGVVGAWALVVEAVAGLLTLAFPEGQGGAGSHIGAEGLVHILCAGISSLCTLVAIPLLGHWISLEPSKGWFRRFSYGAAAAVALAGLAAAVGIGNRLTWGGLAERLTIGGFLLWLAVAAALTHTVESSVGIEGAA